MIIQCLLVMKLSVYVLNIEMSCLRAISRVALITCRWIVARDIISQGCHFGSNVNTYFLMLEVVLTLFHAWISHFPYKKRNIFHSFVILVNSFDWWLHLLVNFDFFVIGFKALCSKFLERYNLFSYFHSLPTFCC